jgi:hypothetical protein
MSISTTVQQLAEFQQYALSRVGQSNVDADDLELDQLLLEWYDHRDRDAIDGIIRQGIRDMETGRGRSARQATNEIQNRLGLQ